MHDIGTSALDREREEIDSILRTSPDFLTKWQSRASNTLDLLSKKTVVSNAAIKPAQPDSWKSLLSGAFGSRKA